MVVRKMPKVTVSIVIPTYNRFNLLLNALKSVKVQTFEDYEILIIDDGSNEPIKTTKMADNRIKIIRHNSNLGEAAARNTGVRNAMGKYIAFLDSDDEWFPEKLKKQIEWMEKQPEIKATTTGYYYLTEEGNSIELPGNNNNWFRHFAQGMDLAPGSTLVSHLSCMLEFPYDTSLPRLVDLDWALRFSQKYKLVVIQEPLAVIHRDSRPSAEKVEQSNLIILDRYKQDISQLGWWFSHFCVGKRYLEIATHFFREGNKRKGKYYLKKSVLENPFQSPSMYIRIIDYLLGTSFIKSFKKIRQRVLWKNETELKE